MSRFFLIRCALENHFLLDDTPILLSQLEFTFISSPAVAALRAKVYYEEKCTKLSVAKWEALFKADPYRLEDIDVYSGLLYVLERKVQLGFLAHSATQIDRNRPETYITIGNLYSSKEQHEKAAENFRKALALDRQNSDTWVLLAHEYLELKMTEAATEAYRRAADVSPRNFRAWFGLGNIYCLLELYPFAIDYFLKALSTRPRDAKIWAQAAFTYHKLEFNVEARYAAERACAVDPDFVDPNMCALLGSLFSISGDVSEEDKRHSEHWYKRAWSLRDSGSMVLYSDNYADTALFLARVVVARAVEEINRGAIETEDDCVAQYREYIDAALKAADSERRPVIRKIRRELYQEIQAALTRARGNLERLGSASGDTLALRGGGFEGGTRHQQLLRGLATVVAWGGGNGQTLGLVPDGDSNANVVEEGAMVGMGEEAAPILIGSAFIPDRLEDAESIDAESDANA